jgi:molecular chaperone GrpE
VIKKPVQDEEGQEIAGATPTALDEKGLDVEALASELQAAKAKASESQEKMLRLAADFDNTKKRLIREQDNALKYAEEYILRDLLPTIDNLERALEQGRKTDDVNALLAGVEMVLQGLTASLEKFGLKAINGVGEPFDPNFHEALAMEASKEVPENRILVEFEKGYLYKERLLRAAKVVVSKGDVSA